MKRLLLASTALVGLGWAGSAFAACPAINPNISAPPFVDGCPLPAATLNRVIGQGIYGPLAIDVAAVAMTLHANSSTGNDNLTGAATSVVGGTNHCTALATPCKTLRNAAYWATTMNFQGGLVMINATGTFAECVSINGIAQGQVNVNQNPRSFGFGVSMVVFNGTGDGGSMTWNGCTGYSYTLQAANFGTVGIENLTISGTNEANQIAFGMSLGGVGYDLGGVTYAGANTDLIHAENPSSDIYFWGAADTISGGAVHAFNVSDEASLFLGPYTSFTISGTPKYTSAFAVVSSGGDLLMENTGTTFTGSIDATTPMNYIVQSNGIVTNQTGGTNPLLGLGGGLPLEKGGGRTSPEPVSTVTASTGLGSGGTAVLTGSGLRHGFVVLTTAGSGAGDHGTVTITPAVRAVDDNGTVETCTVQLGGGDTAWGIGYTYAEVSMNFTTGVLLISWFNYVGDTATALTSSVSYQLYYNCIS